MTKKLSVSLICVLIMLIFTIGVVQAESQWTLEIFLGDANSFQSPLGIYQDGEDPILFDKAEYETRPNVESPYYSVRVAKWVGDKAWEMEIVHHKLYLVTDHPDIQHFEITHGYNQITLNRAWKYKGLIWHLGGGFIFAHPETEIRNKENPVPRYKPFDTNFYVAGPTGQAAVSKKIKLYGDVSAVLEGKFTASYARIPVADGHAEVPNSAVHWLYGLSYDF